MMTTFKAQTLERNRGSTWETFSEDLKRNVDTLRQQTEVGTQALNAEIDSLRISVPKGGRTEELLKAGSPS